MQTASPHEELANLPFKDGYVARDHAPALLDELFFERAVQTYLGVAEPVALRRSGSRCAGLWCAQRLPRTWAGVFTQACEWRGALMTTLKGDRHDEQA